MKWQNVANDYSSKVEAHLNHILKHQPALPTQLLQAMTYSLMAGGKRVRPFLVLATGEMLSVPQTKLLDCAAAIECIHTYSLIHDDLPAMDDDELRRGNPTCHIQFDEATAILAGDALQSMAFEVISHSKALDNRDKVNIIQTLSKASGYSGMCGGQAIDLANTGRQVKQSQLAQMHQLKTGALISASIKMASQLAQINQDSDAALLTFANAIGLGFQVKDDILDVEGDTKLLGKPQGSDEKSAKSTYPSLMGLNNTKEYLQQLHREALQALNTIPYNTQTLTTFTDYLFNRDH